MKSKRRQAYDEYLQFSQQAQGQSDSDASSREGLYEGDYEVYDDYSAPLDDVQSEVMGQRAKYSAKIDRFLNNGIIITGVLLLVVLAIAFLI